MFKQRAKESGSAGNKQRFNKNTLWTFNKYSIPKGSVKHVAFLTDLYKGIYLKLHYISAKSPMSVCNKMYFDKDDPAMECSECAKPSSFDPTKSNFASMFLCLVGFVFDDVGQKRTSKKGVEYDINPLQIIMIPGKDKGILLEEIEDADANGYLTSELWKFKRTENGDLAAPTIITAKQLSKQFDPELHLPYLKEYEAKTEGEVLSQIMAAFTNVKYDHSELVKLGIKPLEDSTEEKVNQDHDALD